MKNNGYIYIENMLSEAGVELGGGNPWDPKINDPHVFWRIATGGSRALGESFMDRSWDVDDLAQLVFLIQSKVSNWDRAIATGEFIQRFRAFFSNAQKKRAYEVGEAHYDLGNDLYATMLDKRMIYTCAYWQDARTLDEAQEAKLDLICKKLGLKEGDRVLDIGCGWGGFMKYASEKYGVSCVGLSVSKEQTKYGEEVCAGLPIEFVVTDYRAYESKEKFDHVVSIEMFEAVGHKNYRTFMERVCAWLKDNGRVLLQTITTTHNKPLADPWLDTYIFPNGVLPNKALIEKNIKGLLVAHDWHSIGKDYDRTLMEWWKNFDAGYAGLPHAKYDERFYRMWKYYLQMCAGGFRSGYLDDWQIVLSKPSYAGEIRSVR